MTLYELKVLDNDKWLAFDETTIRVLEWSDDGRTADVIFEGDVCDLADLLKQAKGT